MLRQRLRPVGVCLVVALAALATWATLGALHHDAPSRGEIGEAAFALRSPRVDASATRLTGDERRDRGGAERGLQQRLVLVVLTAGLLTRPSSARRRAEVGAAQRCTHGSWWSPGPGRAPPASQPLIA